MDEALWRRLPLGAEPAPGGGVHFRVWAPARREVAVVLQGSGGGRRSVALGRDAEGFFSGLIAEVRAGDRYGYALDGEDRPFPDPMSRCQPDGPHGLSEVVDCGAFAWTDERWPGVERFGQVLYELHVGTFTREGTFAAATRELEWLAGLGVTIVELMPVADFPGAFGWGYDGVNLFAPYHAYGRPDDLRRLVDTAHAQGLGVTLDVVYNHIGPDGNYLAQYGPWMSRGHVSEWGDSLNYDEPGSEVVRAAVAANAAYWIDEYHMDGLRLDATQQVFDDSAEHVLALVTRAAREAGRRAGRPVYICAENEPQDAKLIAERRRGGYGIDALWNDDFHHTAAVALTGRREAYRTDYRGSPQEFVSAARHGFLFQGQRYEWQKQMRGTPTFGYDADRFVHYLDNHDQVANAPMSARSDRLSNAARYRALTALLLLGPQTPLLFQGQEFAASAPFYYFADHDAEVAEKVWKGRNEFVAQFPSLATPDMQQLLPNPSERSTFERSKLDLAERDRHPGAVALHRDLIRLRRGDATLAAAHARPVDGAVITPEAFVLRFFGEAGDDRLLVINLGADLDLIPAPEPLLAPPAGRHWELLWSSEHPCYGGQGVPALEGNGRWHLMGEAAQVLKPGDGAVPPDPDSPVLRGMRRTA